MTKLTNNATGKKIHHAININPFGTETDNFRAN